MYIFNFLTHVSIHFLVKTIWIRIKSSVPRSIPGTLGSVLPEGARVAGTVSALVLPTCIHGRVCPQENTECCLAIGFVFCFVFQKRDEKYL